MSINSHKPFFLLSISYKLEYVAYLGAQSIQKNMVLFNQKLRWGADSTD